MTLADFADAVDRRARQTLNPETFRDLEFERLPGGVRWTREGAFVEVAKVDERVGLARRRSAGLVDNDVDEEAGLPLGPVLFDSTADVEKVAEYLRWLEPPAT
jgi:hypothetical protein